MGNIGADGTATVLCGNYVPKLVGRSAGWGLLEITSIFLVPSTVLPFQMRPLPRGSGDRGPHTASLGTVHPRCPIARRWGHHLLHPRRGLLQRIDPAVALRNVVWNARTRRVPLKKAKYLHSYALPLRCQQHFLRYARNLPTAPLFSHPLLSRQERDRPNEMVRSRRQGDSLVGQRSHPEACSHQRWHLIATWPPGALYAERARGVGRTARLSA